MSELFTPEQQLVASFTQAVHQQRLLKCVLSKYQGQESALQRVTIRLILLRNEAQLSFLYSYQTNDMTKNFSLEEGTSLLKTLLGHEFKNANLLTTEQELQLAFSKKGKASLLTKNKTVTVETVNSEHNREKQRFLTLDRPFLIDLGVTDEQHQLIPAMSRKWKQINKFIEIFQRAISEAKLDISKPLNVVDFGSGKGYLTFALHDYLRQNLDNPALVTGVELRDNLVQLCNTAIKKRAIEGLQFYQGDVRTYQPETLDVMIALHACDVATDYAIHTGIRLGAAVIMCAPCCHKQIRPQLHSPVVLRPLLQHGVHLGQEAEMLTDGLRALLLEACGYETQVFEFIALEHTSKNKMIMAVKRQNPTKNTELLAQIQALKAFYGIQEQCLETLLKADGLL
ncbi:MAG: SAM-dependent methyltransferase [Agitococcus sp.]|nr:SAM-dependent methyltransferase [Agitococcus sp.]